MGKNGSISGIWSIPSKDCPGNDEFMYLGEEGRAVNFMYLQFPSERTYTMKTWIRFIGDNKYSTGLKPGREDCVVEMRVSGSVLSVVMPKSVMKFESVHESDVPDWFRPKLDKALSEMIEEESMGR